MEKINIDFLIEQGKSIRSGLKYISPPSGTWRTFKVYQLEDERKYHTWASICIRFLNITYPNDSCISSFAKAAEDFEGKANHFCPQPLDKMIGILESCRALPLTIKSVKQEECDVDELINQLESKRSLYKSYTQDSINSRDCIEAYLSWYSDSLVFFAKYVPSDNVDIVKFRSVDNSCNGYGLNDNYNDIQASYFVLINQIRQGIYSGKNEKDVGMNVKPPLLFISHSTNDESFAESFVSLLQTLGFNKNNLFCSSVEGFGIDEGCDIYETLRSKFQEFNIFVVYVLSDNYYNSAACLNEMGAAWVLKSDYSTIILPGFDIPKIRGAINPNKMAIVINDKKHVRSTLNKFRERLIAFFSLVDVDDDIVWENNRNKFLESVQTS